MYKKALIRLKKILINVQKGFKIKLKKVLINVQKYFNKPMKRLINL